MAPGSRSTCSLESLELAKRPITLLQQLKKVQNPLGIALEIVDCGPARLDFKVQASKPAG